jgi:hypothetical protein
MLKTKNVARSMAITAAFTLMAGSSAFAQNRSYQGTYDRVATGYTNKVIEGTVSTVVQERNGERVRLTNGMSAWVPNSVTGMNQGRRYGAATLRPGDVVRMGLYSRKGDGRDAEVQSLQLLSSVNGYNNGAVNGRYNNNGRQLTGTVVSYDRRNNMMVMQTDQGRTVSVNVGAYNSGRGNNATRWRRGDRITVSGRMDRGNFVATDVGRY